ncbi:Signal peptidase I [Candidatus Portiera aleyrodidarum]|uniref:Signal peptidase I n=1 Tax=Candidatus Portiera aleyrodidarum TV TaxID=1297582 RepID=A0A8D4BU32_9GAMM|nr:signal peptidase I [Candidatus Portiera aleyrodidarum]AGI27063.1 signal peptidase I [Candidatus Portiera aleyrodidarum TV]CEI59024.1 Signal peptidase I [Candidatus Portiera aleyrodidarum]
MDFSILLVFAVIITGLISLIRFKKIYEQKNKHWYIEYIRSLFPVFLLVLLVRSFIFEPFQIASGSMLPTLHSCDFVIVNKFNYGLRLPIVNIKILNIGKPTRGDVIVFKYPLDTKLDFIKRVVGIPGDFITYTNKRILINGHEIPESFIKNIDSNKHQLYYPNCVSYKKIFVPETYYLVMGDNSDRYWGFIPEPNIVGRAIAVWMHWGNNQILPNFYSIRMIK